EVMKCKLVVQIGPQSVVVARGQAYPPKDVVTVHGIERQDDHTKVQVDFVFDNFLEFPLPIPIAGGDMFTLGEAKNSFVLWPKSGIQLAEETTVHAKPQQVPHTSPQVLHHTPEKDKMPTPTMEFSDVFHIYNDLALDISLHRITIIVGLLVLMSTKKFPCTDGKLLKSYAIIICIDVLLQHYEIWYASLKPRCSVAPAVNNKNACMLISLMPGVVDLQFSQTKTLFLKCVCDSIIFNLASIPAVAEPP
ncbi:hypothetical protein ACJX0J_042052, partial [Zea mays]